MECAETKMLQMTRHFNAPAERVFEAWVNPEITGKWLFTTPASEAHTIVLDPRVGGQWKITDLRCGTLFTAIGNYRQVNPPRLLEFTFGMPQFSDTLHLVTVTISPEAAGCKLEMVQDKVAFAANVTMLEEGWSKMFDRLNAMLAQSVAQ